MASNDQYTVKLIYLPDLANPMTITFTAGLFGTASFQPTLQDGWMLTSLQSSADNSQAVQLAQSLLTAAAGTGGAATTAGAAKKLTTTAGGGPTAEQLAQLLSQNAVLAPGLYSFYVDPTTKEITRVCAVTYFPPSKSTSGDCSN